MIKIGADLIVQDICIKNKPTDAFWKKLEKALHKRVDKMTNDEIGGWGSEITGGDDISDEEFRKKAHTTITEAIFSMSTSARDMTWIKLPTKERRPKDMITIFLAGGMSHGDSPGETYEDFYKLTMLFPDYRFIDEVLE